jgi:hypothetical protein
MDVTLKIVEKSFQRFKIGELKFLRHGYSCNKKYLRLLTLEKNDIICLKNEQTAETINSLFDSIEVFNENDKKYYQINFI